MQLLEQIISLLIIINPFAAISLYLGLTENYSNLRNRITRWRIVKKMFILLLLFFFIGSSVLSFYGLTIDVIRITGGLLLFFSSWNILNKKQEHEKLLNKKQDISFFPMAMPMLAGPSAIAYIIQLNTNGNLNNILFVAKTIVALIIVSFIVYVVLYLSKWIKLIGDGGLLAMNKLMGFFTLALAIRMIETGLKGMFNIIN